MVPARSVSDRVSSSTSAPYTRTWAFAKEGYETIIINNNPETVSTDFDIADKLYFEPLTPEDVENIVDVEHPDGAVVQFGGQTAIKLTESLMKMGVPILGTKAEDVDAAEDRELFDEILEQYRNPESSRWNRLHSRRGKGSRKPSWLSGTGASVLCTWRTGYADRVLR